MRAVFEDSGLVRRMERVAIALTIVLGVAAWIVFSARDGAGVLIGGALSYASFQGLKRQLGKAFDSPGRRGVARIFAAYYFRFFILALIIGTIIYYQVVHPVALLAGLSVVVTAILAVGVQEYFRLASKGGK